MDGKGGRQGGREEEREEGMGELVGDNIIGNQYIITISERTRPSTKTVFFPGEVNPSRSRCVRLGKLHLFATIPMVPHAGWLAFSTDCCSTVLETLDPTSNRH